MSTSARGPCSSLMSVYPYCMSGAYPRLPHPNRLGFYAPRTMPDSHITPQMLDLVGLELRSATSFPITDSDIRRWAIAVYYPEPAPRLFWDAAYAAGTVHGGIVAPEDFNPFAWLTQTEADVGVSARPTGAFVGPEETFGLPAPATTAI